MCVCVLGWGGGGRIEGGGRGGWGLMVKRSTIDWIIVDPSSVVHHRKSSLMENSVSVVSGCYTRFTIGHPFNIVLFLVHIKRLNF